MYPEERMRSFLDIIGDEVVSLVRNIIDEVTDYRIPATAVHINLNSVDLAFSRLRASKTRSLKNKFALKTDPRF